MSRKINWEISTEYGVKGIVTASTRNLAISLAEAEWLKETADWRYDFMDEDGVFHPACVLPTYTARKLS